MHKYKVYFILQPNSTGDIDYTSNLDIEEFYAEIVARGYLRAIVAGTNLLVPIHAITGILEGTL